MASTTPISLLAVHKFGRMFRGSMLAVFTPMLSSYQHLR
nr:MAG TPA: hypothetical protein [Caudoviricetes sp.]